MFLVGWLVSCAVTGDGVTIGTGERVARFILRFAAFFSLAFILKGIYFSENPPPENLGHPTFPKKHFFLDTFSRNRTIQA
jgi:hypothetical protein